MISTEDIDYISKIWPEKFRDQLCWVTNLDPELIEYLNGNTPSFDTLEKAARILSELIHVDGLYVRCSGAGGICIIKSDKKDYSHIEILNDGEIAYLSSKGTGPYPNNPSSFFNGDSDGSTL